MKRKLKLPELLVPVGDMEKLISALHFGADAVYLAGKTFGMRASPNNFSEEELAEAVHRCHEENIRVYVTCNTIPHNAELCLLPPFLQHCQNIGVDGLIIADLGVLELAKKYAPQVDIHISTQAGVASYAAANAFYALGAKRVVLARELSFAEISEIRQKTPPELEIEAFVHGAMCMSFSGRCLLSFYLTGRDANRGDCAQPCRWEYELIEKKRPNERFSIEEESQGQSHGSTYILNSKDMCMIEHIPQLIASGITSLKIEGRAKSAYYVACVTAAYRNAMDYVLENPSSPLPKWIVEETEKISHREYSTGFYLGTEPGQTTENGGYIRHWDVAAICEGREGPYLKLAQRNRFFRGDIANVLESGVPPFSVILEEIFDEYENPIEVAPHAAMTVFFKTDMEISKGAYLRIPRK
ncbi:MAG: U32 family peptidase [Oscillospiraceae bacterium]